MTVPLPWECSWFTINQNRKHLLPQSICETSILTETQQLDKIQPFGKLNKVSEVFFELVILEIFTTAFLLKSIMWTWNYFYWSLKNFHTKDTSHPKTTDIESNRKKVLKKEKEVRDARHWTRLRVGTWGLNARTISEAQPRIQDPKYKNWDPRPKTQNHGQNFWDKL